VIDRHAAFGHHLLEIAIAIAIAYAVAAVPAHRPEHDLTLKVAPLEVRHGPAPSLALAFHRGAAFNVTEFGTVKNPEQFRALHSPNAKGNFRFDRVIALDRSRCVLDSRLKR